MSDLINLRDHEVSQLCETGRVQLRGVVDPQPHMHRSEFIGWFPKMNSLLVFRHHIGSGGLGHDLWEQYTWPLPCEANGGSPVPVPCPLGSVGDIKQWKDCLTMKITDIQIRVSESNIYEWFISLELQPESTDEPQS